MSGMAALFGGRNFALDAVRITENAALAAADWMGRGDEQAADAAAAAAMCDALHSIDLDGLVVIGEFGDHPGVALCAGDSVGSGAGPAIDVALSPLEGITACARGGANALSVVVMTDRGGFLSVPDLYMDKIAVGPDLPSGVIDLDATPEDNLRALAEAKRVRVRDLLVCILNRPRHGDLIERVRDAGARITLISDGDVSGILATMDPQSGVDVFMGVGGAPQGVLAAAALSCVGGQMQGRLHLRGPDDRRRAIDHGIAEPDRAYHLSEMAVGDVMVAITGVTPGALLRGVQRGSRWTTTHSLVMRSSSGTVRYIESRHRLDSGGRLILGG